jgi:SAM-dependent methyltransferase
VVQFIFRRFPAREDREGLTALDLGCGTGVHTQMLAAEGFKVTALDLAPAGVQATRRLLMEKGLEARLLVGSIDEVEYGHGFDIVICTGILESAGPHVASRAVPRVAERLRAGGQGLFVFASDADCEVTGGNPLQLHGYSRDEVEQLFAPHFSSVDYDRYITTFESGRVVRNDWLITVHR